MALEIGKTYYIKNVATGKYLNVYGTDTVANSRNVNTYAKEDCLAQKWTVGLYGNGARVYTAINSAYALNINTSNNNCTMYLAASNSEADSVVDFLTVSASNNQYRIKMMAHNKYLSVTTSDDNAYWASSADSYSLWQLEEVSTSTAIVTTAPSAIVNQTFFIKNYNTGYNLNVYGTDTVADGRNVNVYSKENCLAQKWIVRQKSDGAKLCTAINESFTLNIDTSTNNCTMYTESSNVSEDCVLEFVPYTDATVTSADKVYRIKMANHNLYLDVESVGSGANAYWVSGTTGYSLWQFVTEADMFPIAPNAPSEIVGSTFAIKAYGTDYNLNVNGTDTVADGRNVNIYSKEDCLAQRWVVRNTSYGPKIFTKIDESFALNIYTADNNCTMYTAASNDDDSILAFEEVADMLYRIKMFNHDKYLCIDGAASSGSNVIWSDTASTATLWEFIPEATMFLTPAAAPTAIVGSTFFIKNFYTGYNLNVHGTDTVANGRNVNVYSKENCLAQKWQVIQTAKGPKIVTAIDPTFALNIYSEDNPNCTMYKANVSNIDTVLEFEPYTDAQVTSADKVYKIKLFHHGKYLDAEGIGSEYNVCWDETPDYPLWQFVTEEDMFPLAGNAPQSVIDKTFFLQNVNTGYFLNINGNETVSNTAQVNVYAKENVQAQRWVIRNTAAGPKMFTKLNENFALNIYAKDNNCTMYDADVSDTDTVLEIIPYSAEENIYRIKMHYHGRYMTVTGLGIGSNCYWTAADTDASTLWRLIPESEMAFDPVGEADITPDSPLVKTDRFLAMPTGTYMVGRDGIDISEITIHHTATVVDSIEEIHTSWINSGRAVSSHYCVRDHDIVQFVKECNTAYTNGGDLWDPTDTHYNHRAITIETCNSGGESAGWPVSDYSFETLIMLVADIARRNNLGKLVVGQNLKGHSHHANTLCPGPYLAPRMQEIADRVNAINDEAVFIRKLGTQYPLVLTSTASNEGYGVTFSETVSESNQKWIIKDTAEGKEIINALDTTQNLRLNSTNDAFVVSSDENLAKAYLIPSEDNAEKFSIRATINSVLRTVTYVWMGVTIAGISVVDAENKGEFVDTSTNADAPPAQLTTAIVPDKLDDWRFKIKNGEYYITVTGQDISLSGKTTDPNQVFEIENSYMGPNIKSLSGTNSYLSINPLNNEPFSILPMVIDRNTSLNIKFEPLNQTTHPNQYYIHSLRYDKYLGVDKSNPLLAAGELMWGKYTSDTYENFIWTLEEPEPKPINDWLVAYYNPQDRANARNVEIPNYAYRLPKSDEGGNFEEVDCFIRKDVTGNDILFEFTNRNYWFAQESGFSDYVPEAVLNTYGVSETTLPRKATQGTYKDYYWVAVGPNVIKSNYPDDGRPGSEMYGLGTLDAVISDAEGRIYYIPCIPGDIKAHSWNNGVFQTYLRYFNPYENTDSSIDQYDVALRDDTAPYIVEMKKYNLTSYNKTACIEFIGYDLNSKGEKITMPETSLNKYSIERIIFYDNPIV